MPAAPRPRPTRPGLMALLGADPGGVRFMLAARCASFGQPLDWRALRLTRQVFRFWGCGLGAFRASRYIGAK